MSNIHGGSSGTQVFDGQSVSGSLQEAPDIDPAITQALDRMIEALKAGIALKIPEWGGRTADELEMALEWWERAKVIFHGKIDLTWKAVHEPAIHPKNSARSLKLRMQFPAWVDGKPTWREAYPKSYALRIDANGTGLAQALRGLIESTCMS